MRWNGPTTPLPPQISDYKEDLRHKRAQRYNYLTEWPLNPAGSLYKYKNWRCVDVCTEPTPTPSDDEIDITQTQVDSHALAEGIILACVEGSGEELVLLSDLLENTNKENMIVVTVPKFLTCHSMSIWPSLCFVIVVIVYIYWIGNLSVEFHCCSKLTPPVTLNRKKSGRKINECVLNLEVRNSVWPNLALWCDMIWWDKAAVEICANQKWINSELQLASVRQAQVNES